MTLDEQILIAKDEKLFNEAVEDLTAEIDELEKQVDETSDADAEGDSPTEANIYALNYSDTGEEIANYDYNNGLDNLRDSETVTVMEAVRLGRICDYSLEQLKEGKIMFHRAVAQIRENVNKNLDNINNGKDFKSICESYRYLAKVKVLLEGESKKYQGKNRLKNGWIEIYDPEVDKWVKSRPATKKELLNRKA